MKPLEGIRVVEMTTMIAAPSCGRQLAHLGAEVIKIESLTGDPYRSITTLSGGIPVIFDVLNAGKKSVAVNAKSEAVNEVLLNIFDDTDIFLSNIRTESLGRLGLSWQSLHMRNPRLIYAHFSGYGEEGPLSKLPGYDATAFFARSGLYRDFTAPENEPVNHVYGFGDMVCGLALSTNILAALFNRRQTGMGEKIECALNQLSAWTMLMPMVYEQFGSVLQRERGKPVDVANATMLCKDGEYICYNCGTEKQWKGYCHALGLDALLEDPRARTLSDVIKHTPELLPEILPVFLKHSAEEWVEIFRTHDVPCERHRHVAEMASDEQLLTNGYIHPLAYSDTSVMVPAPPIRFSSDGLSRGMKAEPLGAHTEAVLKAFGCTQACFERLKKTGDILVT